MALEYPNVLSAGCAANSDGTAIWAGGCTPAKTGTGTYTVTLARPVDADNCSIYVQRRGAQTFATEPSIVHTSDSVKTITFTTGTTSAVTDTAFDFLLVQAPGNR